MYEGRAERKEGRCRRGEKTEGRTREEKKFYGEVIRFSFILRTHYLTVRRQSPFTESPRGKPNHPIRSEGASFEAARSRILYPVPHFVL